MSRYWSAGVNDLDPYVPGEQPAGLDLLKLNTNELPHGPSPRALAAIRAQACETLRLYPDPDSTALRDALAAYQGVGRASVFVGNGSDEVLAHAFAGLLKHEAPLLFPDVTYGFYPVYCRLFGIRFETVPLDERLRIRVGDYRRDAGAVVIANPNAQTGTPLARAEIARLLEDHPDIPVVIDEAYVDFGGETSVGLIDAHPNLLVVRTFSKSRGLAGLRVGYALGDPALIEALVRVKNSFNSYPLGRPSQAGAIASLEDEAHFQATRGGIIGERLRLVDRLAHLGFEIVPSAANFVLVRDPDRPGSALASRLRTRGILVRHFPRTRIEDYVRITIGSAASMDRLLETMSELRTAMASSGSGTPALADADAWDRAPGR